MKMATKFLIFFSTFCFSVITMGSDGLSLYVSSSGSVSSIWMVATQYLFLPEGINLTRNIGWLCGFGELGRAVKGGFEGRLIPVSTEFNSYDEDQAQGKNKYRREGWLYHWEWCRLVGICSLDSDLINVYEKINVDDISMFFPRWLMLLIVTH